MNLILIAGTVGNVRKGEHNGKPVLNFSVAVNEGKDRTTWFECALWGDRVDGVGRYIDKGGKVAVAGSVSADLYDGKGKLKVFVRDVTLQGSANAHTVRQSAQSASQTSTAAGMDDLDEDIPF